MVEVEERIRALRLIFGHKQELLRLLANEFNLHLPSTAPYERIMREIVDVGTEREFCQRVFHANSFDEGVLVLNLRLGLGNLPWDTLKELADVLSESEKKWRFSKARNRDMIAAIIRNSSKDEVDEAIRRSIEDNRLDPVRQHGQWVIGPLGITQSVRKRGFERSDSLVAFLSKHVDASICEEILEISGFVPPAKLESSLLQPKTIQMILTYGGDDDIFQLFNHLLDTGKIRIETREDYWGFFATPVGVFEEPYADPIGELATLLISHLNEKAVRKELRLREGDYRLQIMRQCLNEKPDAVLEKLFGMPDLRRIARDMGLVAIDSLSDKKALVESILLKLGFEVPRPPEGIMAARRVIETNLRELENVDLAGKIGLVTSAYVQLERLLKDMVFFYVSVMWRDEIQRQDSEGLEALNDFMTAHFKVQKPIGRLTFGELVSMLERIDGETIHGPKQLANISQRFGRKRVFIDGQKDSLRRLSARRKIFAHHVSTPATTEDCTSTLREMLELVRTLEETGVYPKLVLIKDEVRNQYGITILRAEDEQSLPWTIRSDEYWLSPAQHCFLVSETPGVAVDPVIVRRIWEPHG